MKTTRWFAPLLLTIAGSCSSAAPSPSPSTTPPTTPPPTPAPSSGPQPLAPPAAFYNTGTTTVVIDGQNVTAAIAVGVMMINGHVKAVQLSGTGSFAQYVK